MAKFFLSTDSTADLMTEEIERMGVGFLPLTLTIEKNGKFEFFEEDFKEYSEYVNFYNMLRAAVPIRTSMNNLEKHREYFTSLAQSGVTDCLHLTMSYKLAPTMDIANNAAAEVKTHYPDFNIKVVESHTTTVGQCILVKEAYKLQQEGATLQQAYDRIEYIKHHIQHFIIVDDLYHLKRSGRVSGAAAAIGTMVGLKIYLTFDREGKLAVLKKIMGGRKRAIKTIIEEAKTFTPAKEPYFIAAHSDNDEGVKELVAAAEEEFKVAPEIRIVGPTVGCNLGPGAIALVFVSEEERKI